MNTKTLYWSNVCVGAIIAILGGLCLTRIDVTPKNGIYLWLLFVILIGLSFDRIPRGWSLWKASIIISFVMLLTMTYKGALQTLVSGTYVSVVSVGEVSAEDMMKKDRLVRYGLFYLSIFLMTIPAISIAIYAKSKIVFLGKKLWSIDKEGYSKIEMIINAIFKLISIVIGAILALK
jgi:hypothetical protein